MSTLCTKKEAEGRLFLLQTGCGSAGIHPSKKYRESSIFEKCWTDSESAENPTLTWREREEVGCFSLRG